MHIRHTSIIFASAPRSGGVGTVCCTRTNRTSDFSFGRNGDKKEPNRKEPKKAACRVHGWIGTMVGESAETGRWLFSLHLWQNGADQGTAPDLF